MSETSFPEPPTISPLPAPDAPPIPPTPEATPSHNPYEFIVNPPKKPSTGRHRESLIAKVVVVVGAGLLVIITVVVLANLTLNKRVDPAPLIALAQTQNELIRVATEGTTAQQATVRAAALNTQLVMTTEQQSLVSYLASQGTKLGAAQLGLKKNASTDTQLTAATSANTFDTTFDQLMVNALQSYASGLNTAFTHAAGKKERALLVTNYSQVLLLLKQWPTAAQLADTN